MAATINTDGLLAGKTAIVTGASRGIGEAIAIRYAMEGARVAVAARTVNEGDHRLLSGSINGVAGRIRDAGGEALAIQCNLADADDRANLVATTERELGPVDILVNNGAVTYYISVDEFPESRFNIMMQVQVYAAMHLCQLVLPGMRERKSGWIVNMSSGAAILPDLDARINNGTIYGMCKAALERFSSGLATEARDGGIAVNAIRPGLVATPGVEYFGMINDENRAMVTPVEDVAEASLRLAHGDPATLSCLRARSSLTSAAHPARRLNLPRAAEYARLRSSGRCRMRLTVTDYQPNGRYSMLEEVQRPIDLPKRLRLRGPRPRSRRRPSRAGDRAGPAL